MVTPELFAAELHSSLTDASLSSMNFLNEVAQRFPEAISFAAGRPHEANFDVALIHEYLDTYCRHLAEAEGRTEEQVRRALFQYGRTKGIIHDLIARNLAADEDVVVDPESIVVTVGCQEAMVLTLRALRRDERDVLLAVSPTYVGITGAARLVDMPVVPVSSGDDGVDLDDLTAVVRRVRGEGLRPRAFYLVPDFSNPAGKSLPTSRRRELLRLADEFDLLLLEDNPYGVFRARGERLPTLKSLDATRRVVYLGSFAKTGMPGARVGFAVADQLVGDAAGGDPTLFADELSKIKSMLTVNTSPVAQAVIGGKLIAHDYSLLRANEREIATYARNLAQLLDGLERRFTGPSRDAVPRVTWNTPAGGFFAVVTVPFDVTDELLALSAHTYGVIWTPMRHFYDGVGGERQLRLSCSLLDPDTLDTGLDRLAAFITDQV
ncbi:PLP-dependent aminotransferase family protein [Streptomyces griseoluteus]|uniref:PLP-dependent aminotransferase family protein n=1 Tax=Streptomyces griseoluteus TaxID=29306 RepID=A0A4Z1DAH8_STRGP|nr:PLP-dependent aminotransferase family protein [Streptomyces griseoluteus]TGN78771.1 PLP-dependent aminotransferase family protein [Streptomyces griseoluteus]GHE98080.1 aminotransferase [Streptomyces griseoluteus]